MAIADVHRSLAAAVARVFAEDRVVSVAERDRRQESLMHTDRITAVAAGQSEGGILCEIDRVVPDKIAMPVAEADAYFIVARGQAWN